jgi:putative sigma-54 modulation protein
MGIRIQSVHFDASEALEKFIQKKVSKLQLVHDDILDTEVTLRVIKPDTVMNKEASIKVKVSGSELFASKICDTFEEAVDLAIEALQKQLLKTKEKTRTK